MPRLCWLCLALGLALPARAEEPPAAAPLQGLLGGGAAARPADAGPLGRARARLARLEAQPEARRLAAQTLEQAASALRDAQQRLTAGEQAGAARALATAEAALEVAERRLALDAAQRALRETEREVEVARARREDAEAQLERARQAHATPASTTEAPGRAVGP